MKKSYDLKYFLIKFNYITNNYIPLFSYARIMNSTHNHQIISQSDMSSSFCADTKNSIGFRIEAPIDISSQPSLSNEPLSEITILSPANHTNNQNIIFNTKLYNILQSINSKNAELYYSRCHWCGVDETQLSHLTDLQMSRMFSDTQIGLLSEFTKDIKNWQNKINCSPSQTEMIPSIHRNYISSNPNSLLAIISSSKALYHKAISDTPSHQLKTLNSREQSVLMDLIRNHFINNCNNNLDYIQMEALSEEIIKYFPGEDKLTYYNKVTRFSKGVPIQKAIGKLPIKWGNRKDKENKKTRIEVNHCYTMPLQITDIANETEQKNIRLNLMANQSYPVTMIIQEWKMSKELRFKCIQSNKENPQIIFSDWPFYTQPEGYILVRIYKIFKNLNIYIFL